MVEGSGHGWRQDHKRTETEATGLLRILKEKRKEKAYEKGNVKRREIEVAIKILEWMLLRKYDGNERFAEEEIDNLTV